MLIPPRLIPNSTLTVAQVPTANVRALSTDGWMGDVDDYPEWLDLWRFALTFDGYRYFGGDDGAAERLGRFADSIRDAFQKDGKLPALDLAQLRACLFFEQRRWCKASMTGPDERAKNYLQHLLATITASIT